VRSIALTYPNNNPSTFGSQVNRPGLYHFSTPQAAIIESQPLTTNLSNYQRTPKPHGIDAVNLLPLIGAFAFALGVFDFIKKRKQR
jgi:hypothetical protein